MESLTNLLLRVAILAPPILLALTMHETAHGFVAWLRGDPTAKNAGRLTLNPFRHLDPAGTLVFFITAWLGAGFGWAKPVPVDPRRLRDPRRDMILVSAAGPVVNLLTAAVVGFLYGLAVNAGMFAPDAMGQYHTWQYYLRTVFEVGVQINVVLACFNLIPLPPLDGSGILAGLLPIRAAYRYQQYSRYGFGVLLALMFLPDLLPGFPDLIQYLVLWPAERLIQVFLPY